MAASLLLSSLRSTRVSVLPALRAQRRCKSGSSIASLMDAFRNPASPFHIAPGTVGPDSPDPPTEAELSHTLAQLKLKVVPHTTHAAHIHTEADADADARTGAAEGRRKLEEMGFDPGSFWEQPVVWGDHDAFQHVNNVRYVRFFESSRIEWMRSLGAELGGEAKVAAMLQGRGVSLILKSISIDYRRPVVYPDTLLVAHRVHAGAARGREAERVLPRTHFGLSGTIWSYRQRRVVTECDSVIVWYDYDRLAKCDPGSEAREALLRRMNLGLSP